MKVTYGIVEETYNYKEEVRVSYGIAAFADATTIIASCQDITSDKQKLQDLINLCNELDLSPIHLNDVVQDFLVEYN